MIKPHAMNAILYCRVSTRGQEETGSSLESQEEALRQYAEGNGYAVFRVSREVYSGAELWDRPLLTRDRDDLKAKKAKALICYSTDRLSRDPIHLAIIAQELERVGASLIFVSEPLDSSPEGALIRYVKGYAAQLEREKIRERCLRGKRSRLLSGKIHRSGTELYGYRRDKEAGIRLIYEPEAEVIREIYRRLLTGESLRSIERSLNALSIPSPSTDKRRFLDGRTAQWRRSQICRIVNDPTYKGEQIGWRWKSRKKRAPVLRPVEENIRLAGITPAIVSEIEWERAQRQLALRHRERSLNQSRPFLLRGMIFCKVCGCRMYSETEHGTTRVYRCSSRESGSTCGGSRVRADFIEQTVLSQAIQVLTDPKYMLQTVKTALAMESEPATDDLKDLQRRYARLDMEGQQLARRYRTATSEAVWSMLEKELETVAQEKARLKSQIASHRQASAKPCLKQIRENILLFCARSAERLAGGGFEVHRKLLEALGCSIQASGKDWSGTLRIAQIAGVASTTFLESGHNAYNIQLPLAA